MARIGFVGLGNMGGPMARNLAKAGHAVAVFDIVLCVEGSVDVRIDANDGLVHDACENAVKVVPPCAATPQMFGAATGPP